MLLSFSITQSCFRNELKTNLIYLTTDKPIAPILFADIFAHATVLLKKDLSNFSVFIKKKEDRSLPSKSKRQNWIFCNHRETAELSVVLTEDGQGGTYFAVTQLDS